MISYANYLDNSNIKTTLNKDLPVLWQINNSDFIIGFLFSYFIALYLDLPLLAFLYLIFQFLIVPWLRDIKEIDCIIKTLLEVVGFNIIIPTSSKEGFRD